MQNRYTLPLLSALVVAASLASCQRKAEEPVVSPGAGRGQVWFEVSERPMGGETKAAPATIETFTTSHESFGVVGYAYASTSPSTKTKDASGTMQVSYVSGPPGRWEPATPVKYSFAGNSLEFYAWYPYNTTTVPVTAPPEIDDTSIDPTHPTITYTVPPAVADQKDLMVAKASDVTDSPTGDGRVELTFSHMLTAVKFSIGVGTTCSSITLSGIFGQGTLDMTNDYWLPPVGTADSTYTITSPTFGSADANGQRLIDEAYTLMLIPQTLSAGATLTAETPAGTITASLAGQVWEPGKEVTYKLTDPDISFSVSDTQKVRFSPGNLQAVFAAAGSTFTWKFADNQWDVVGNKEANTSIDDNGSVSAAGTVDLFGWSTAATTYGISDSHNYADYNGTFREWGEDSDLISTLGSGWRTLTYGEWVYLLETRDNDDNESTLYPRYCKATVNGVPGLVIFPDGFYDLSVLHDINDVNTSGAAFTSNNWSGDVWTMMESAGCVFLPAAGLRMDTPAVSGVYTNGFYWSSTLDGNNKACIANIAVTPPYGSARRHVGSSVRLVQDL